MENVHVWAVRKLRELLQETADRLERRATDLLARADLLAAEAAERLKASDALRRR